ncbi:element excision factor XisH family protein [Microcoleus sp. F8-D3]
MSAKDVFHEVVKIALQKDGWQITHDPYTLSSQTELITQIHSIMILAAKL